MKMATECHRNLQELRHITEPEKEELMHQLKVAKTYGRHFGNILESSKKVSFLFVLLTGKSVRH